jgi:hypothetical protein
MTEYVLILWHYHFMQQMTYGRFRNYTLLESSVHRSVTSVH